MAAATTPDLLAVFDSRAEERARRLELQAEFPQCFAACPACGGRRTKCALCLETRMVTKGEITRRARERTPA